MTREIPLTRGYGALVDDADYDLVVSAGCWCASVKPKTVYAIRGARRPDGRGTTIRMHTLITGWPFVDHVNGDGLDNRRCNLRPASHATNARNVGLIASNTSGFKGVTWSTAADKWVAQIHVNKHRIHLGVFVDPVEAARAYDAAALIHFGEFARLNFPKEIAS